MTKFYDNWAYQGVSEQNNTITSINEFAGAGASTAPGDVLDFSEVDQDLVFTLKGNGSVNVISTASISGKSFKFLVVANGIHEIVGGKKKIHTKY